jgi:hypothetical protein
MISNKLRSKAEERRNQAKQFYSEAAQEYWKDSEMAAALGKVRLGIVCL